MSSKNTFRVLFFLNKSKTNNDGAPYHASYYHQWPTSGLKRTPKNSVFDWDQKRGLPLVRDAFTRDLDLYLETMRNKAFKPLQS